MKYKSIYMKLKPLDNWCHLLEYLAFVVLSLHMLSMTRNKITCPSLDRNFSKHPIHRKNFLSQVVGASIWQLPKSTKKSCCIMISTSLQSKLYLMMLVLYYFSDQILYVQNIITPPKVYRVYGDCAIIPHICKLSYNSSTQGIESPYASLVESHLPYIPSILVNNNFAQQQQQVVYTEP